jgi:uncharacterized protein (TIGR00106 family)
VVVAHLSVTAYPADGASVGKWVRLAVAEVRRSGLRHEVHAMGTELECDNLRQLFQVVNRIDRALAKAGALRVGIQLKIDHRLDRPVGLRDKVRSATRRP